MEVGKEEGEKKPNSPTFFHSLSSVPPKFGSYSSIKPFRKALQIFPSTFLFRPHLSDPHQHPSYSFRSSNSAEIPESPDTPASKKTCLPLSHLQHQWTNKSYQSNNKKWSILDKKLLTRMILHMYVCVCVYFVWMVCVHVCGNLWRSDVNLRCQSSPSTLSETRSVLFFHGIFQVTGLQMSGDSCGFTCHLTVRVLGLQLWTTVPSLTWAIGIRTQIPMLLQWAFDWALFPAPESQHMI